jgi:hypothetical protein
MVWESQIEFDCESLKNIIHKNKKHQAALNDLGMIQRCRIQREDFNCKSYLPLLQKDIEISKIDHNLQRFLFAKKVMECRSLVGYQKILQNYIRQQNKEWTLKDLKQSFGEISNYLTFNIVISLNPGQTRDYQIGFLSTGLGKEIKTAQLKLLIRLWGEEDEPELKNKYDRLLKLKEFEVNK